MKRFMVLISGRGSNMEALLKAWRGGALQAEPVGVISNRSQAPGLDVARSYGVPTQFVSFKDATAGETEVLAFAREWAVDFVVLAGFMRVISPALIDAFPNRIINIHPSLLPSFPGLHAQEQAWEYGVRVSGCTTHFVNAGVDTGPIILQRTVPVFQEDDPATVAARILEEEHPLLVETVNLMAEERLRVEGRRVLFS